MTSPSLPIVGWARALLLLCRPGHQRKPSRQHYLDGLTLTLSLCVHYRLGKRSEELRCMLRPMTCGKGEAAPTGCLAEIGTAKHCPFRDVFGYGGLWYYRGVCALPEGMSHRSGFPLVRNLWSSVPKIARFFEGYTRTLLGALTDTRGVLLR
jgi:hypothetical protein